MSDITGYSGVTQKSNYTANGTRIVKNNGELDKNQFLRILSAELSNQDPTNPKDSTEYVAQMAQFAGLEQMANLNISMQLIGASSLMGKKVILKTYDENGNLYQGIVQNIIKDGDTIKLNVLVGKNDLHQFEMSDVTQIT